MNAAMAENLKERAREKMKEAKKPEIVLLIENWKCVTGKGELMTLIFVGDVEDGLFKLIIDCVTVVGKRKGVMGD